MSSSDTSVSPFAALGVAVLAVSTSAILVRWSDAPSLAKAFYRVLFTVLLLSPLAVGRHADEFGRIDRRDLLGASLAGVALAFHFGAWFESLNHTSVAASVTLVQVQPVFVALGAALFLDERVTRRVALGITVALGGMVLMGVGDPLLSSLTSETAALTGPATLYGNALAVVGAIAAALYLLSGRALRQRVSLIPYVIVVYSVCAVVLLALLLARGHGFVYPLREYLLFFGMAIGPGVLGHTIINWALAHLDSSVVSVSLLGEPVGSTLLALVILTEVPSPVTLAGGAVVLGGIYLTAVRR